MKHSILLLILMFLALAVPLCALASDSDEVRTNRMWWEEEQPDNNPHGFLRSTVYGITGATGQLISAEVGAGFLAPNVGYVGLASSFETGSRNQKLYDEGYEHVIPYGLFLGYEKRLENRSTLAVEFYFADGLQLVTPELLLYEGTIHDFWMIQPTIRYGMPLKNVRLWESRYSNYQRGLTLSLIAGTRILPYGLDFVMGVAVQ